jgi:hypothetical protein
MNNRHKKYGFNAAQKLAEELERHVQGEEAAAERSNDTP